MKTKIVYGLLGMALLAGASTPQISPAADWGSVLSEAMSDPEITAGAWIDAQPGQAMGPAPLDMRFALAFISQGDLSQYQLRWDFGDGTSSTDQIVEHRYETVGEYFVDMLAIGPEGRRIEGRKRILVTAGENQLPSAKIAVAQKYYRAGEIVTLDGSASSDEDGTITSYEWTIGDALNSIQLENAGQAVVSFTMPQDIGPEGLDIGLKIKDDQGAYSSDTSSILALGAVEVESSVTSGTPPIAPVFSIKVNTDEGIRKYTIDYEGGGKYRESSTQSDAFTHTYELEGAYTVLVEVETDSGERYRGRYPIEVLSREKEMEEITARWQKMTGSLCKGDIDDALSYFYPITKSQYQMQFLNMTPENINGVFCGEVIELSLRSLSDYYAQLILVLQTEAAGPMQFPLKMLRDPTPGGDWYVLSIM